MNKRADTIRSLFTASQDALSADNRTVALPRVSAGSVRALKDSFSGVERENEELRRQIVAGAAVIEIDAGLIDPSHVRDRFVRTDDGSFEKLKMSIAERGQEIPVLVRPHPDQPGRYQSAYGHRRVRAGRELGRSVRAIVRPLSDEELVLAQGIENSARDDLSFIERAVFASRLEDAGYSRSIIQDALSVDRAEASKLVSVARSVPNDIIDVIGKAGRVGRPRWQALADMLKKPDAVKRVRAAVSSDRFLNLDSDERFNAVLAATVKSDGTARSSSDHDVVSAESGRAIATVKRSKAAWKIMLDEKAQAGFGAFLVDQLPDLFEAYLQAKQEKTAKS